MAATTIDEVIDVLDEVVARSLREGHRIGYFAALYRTVTAQVRHGLEVGFFDDAERMEHLDVVFANRFLHALGDHEQGRRPTHCWQLAFEAAERWPPVILQHLLVGINAHINLDLGVAAARTAPGDELPGLRRDFDRINEMLAGLVTGVRGALGDVSPWIGLVDRLGGRRNDVVINFSLTVARREAWRLATELAVLPPAEQASSIRLRDEEVARLASVVLRPGWLRVGLLLVRLREGWEVTPAIEALGDVPAPTLAAVEDRVRDDRAS